MFKYDVQYVSRKAYLMFTKSINTKIINRVMISIFSIFIKAFTSNIKAEYTIQVSLILGIKE